MLIESLRKRKSKGMIQPSCYGSKSRVFRNLLFDIIERNGAGGAAGFIPKKFSLTEFGRNGSNGECTVGAVNFL
jgi:hypothetical protein